MSSKSKKKSVKDKGARTRSRTGSLPPRTPPFSPGPPTSSAAVGSSTRRHKPPPCRWVYTVIDPATLPVPVKPWTTKTKRKPYTPKPLGFLSTKRLKKRRASAILPRRWPRDDIQLAYIYVNQRRHREQPCALNMTLTNQATTSSKKRKQQSDLVTVAQILEDVVESVTKQPTIQKVRSRILRIPIKGRVVPRSLVDSGELAEELKLRLAAITPVLDSHTNHKTGKYSFRQRPHATRVVTLYAVDEEGDPHEKHKVKVRQAQFGGKTFTFGKPRYHSSPIPSRDIGSRSSPGSAPSSSGRSRQIASSPARRPSTTPGPSTSRASSKSAGSREKMRKSKKKGTIKCT